MRRKDELSLDVDRPEDVPNVLRRAAEEYFEARGELQASWQEREAGWEWEEIARVLEQAARKIENTIEKPLKRGRFR